MIDLETHPPNRAILRLLYYGGLRVSELCDLKWKNLQVRGNCGQVTVYRKGGKTKTVLVPAGLWVDLVRLRERKAIAVGARILIRIGKARFSRHPLTNTESPLC